MPIPFSNRIDIMVPSEKRFCTKILLFDCALFLITCKYTSPNTGFRVAWQLLVVFIVNGGHIEGSLSEHLIYKVLLNLFYNIRGLSNHYVIVFLVGVQDFDKNDWFAGVRINLPRKYHYITEELLIEAKNTIQTHNSVSSSVYNLFGLFKKWVFLI